MHKISRSDLEKLSNFADVIIRHLLLTLTKSDNKTLKIMAEKKTTKTATKTAAAPKATKKAATPKTAEIAINAENVGFKAGDVYQALIINTDSCQITKFSNYGRKEDNKGSNKNCCST